MAKGLTQEGAQADATFDRAGQQLQRQVKLGEKQQEVKTKFGETVQELQDLRAAEAAKQREKMALQNPLPYMPRYMPRYQ